MPLLSLGAPHPLSLGAWQTRSQPLVQVGMQVRDQDFPSDIPTRAFDAEATEHLGRRPGKVAAAASGSLVRQGQRGVHPPPGHSSRGELCGHRSRLRGGFGAPWLAARPPPHPQRHERFTVALGAQTCPGFHCLSLGAVCSQGAGRECIYLVHQRVLITRAACARHHVILGNLT